jgi:hypothetical protein
MVMGCVSEEEEGSHGESECIGLPWCSGSIGFVDGSGEVPLVALEKG